MESNVRKRLTLVVSLMVVIGVGLASEAALTPGDPGFIYAVAVSFVFTANMIWNSLNFGRYLVFILLGFLVIKAGVEIRNAVADQGVSSLSAAHLLDGHAVQLRVGFSLLLVALGILIGVNMSKSNVRAHFDDPIETKGEQVADGNPH